MDAEDQILNDDSFTYSQCSQGLGDSEEDILDLLQGFDEDRKSDTNTDDNGGEQINSVKNSTEDIKDSNITVLQEKERKPRCEDNFPSKVAACVSYTNDETSQKRRAGTKEKEQEVVDRYTEKEEMNNKITRALKDNGDAIAESPSQFKGEGDCTISHNPDGAEEQMNQGSDSQTGDRQTEKIYGMESFRNPEKSDKDGTTSPLRANKINIDEKSDDDDVYVDFTTKAYENANETEEKEERNIDGSLDSSSCVDWQEKEQSCSMDDLVSTDTKTKDQVNADIGARADDLRGNYPDQPFTGKNDNDNDLVNGRNDSVGNSHGNKQEDKITGNSTVRIDYYPENRKQVRRIDNDSQHELKNNRSGTSSLNRKGEKENANGEVKTHDFLRREEKNGDATCTDTILLAKGKDVEQQSKYSFHFSDEDKDKTLSEKTKTNLVESLEQYTDVKRSVLSGHGGTPEQWSTGDYSNGPVDSLVGVSNSGGERKSETAAVKEIYLGQANIKADMENSLQVQLHQRILLSCHGSGKEQETDDDTSMSETISLDPSSEILKIQNHDNSTYRLVDQNSMDAKGKRLTVVLKGENLGRSAESAKDVGLEGSNDIQLNRETSLYRDDLSEKEKENINISNTQLSDLDICIDSQSSGQSDNLGREGLNNNSSIRSSIEHTCLNTVSPEGSVNNNRSQDKSKQCLEDVDIPMSFGRQNKIMTPNTNVLRSRNISDPHLCEKGKVLCDKNSEDDPVTWPLKQHSRNSSTVPSTRTIITCPISEHCKLISGSPTISTGKERKNSTPKSSNEDLTNQDNYLATSVVQAVRELHPSPSPSPDIACGVQSNTKLPYKATTCMPEKSTELSSVHGRTLERREIETLPSKENEVESTGQGNQHDQKSERKNGGRSRISHAPADESPSEVSDDQSLTISSVTQISQSLNNSGLHQENVHPASSSIVPPQSPQPCSTTIVAFSLSSSLGAEDLVFKEDMYSTRSVQVLRHDTTRAEEDVTNESKLGWNSMEHRPDYEMKRKSSAEIGAIDMCSTEYTSSHINFTNDDDAQRLPETVSVEGPAIEYTIDELITESDSEAIEESIARYENEIRMISSQSGHQQNDISHSENEYPSCQSNKPSNHNANNESHYKCKDQIAGAKRIQTATANDVEESYYEDDSETELAQVFQVEKGDAYADKNTGNLKYSPTASNRRFGVEKACQVDQDFGNSYSHKRDNLAERNIDFTTYKYRKGAELGKATNYSRHEGRSTTNIHHQRNFQLKNDPRFKPIETQSDDYAELPQSVEVPSSQQSSQTNSYGHQTRQSRLHDSKKPVVHRPVGLPSQSFLQGDADRCDADDQVFSYTGRVHERESPLMFSSLYRDMPYSTSETYKNYDDSHSRQPFHNTARDVRHPKSHLPCRTDGDKGYLNPCASINHFIFEYDRLGNVNNSEMNNRKVSTERQSCFSQNFTGLGHNLQTGLESENMPYGSIGHAGVRSGQSTSAQVPKIQSEIRKTGTQITTRKEHPRSQPMSHLSSMRFQTPDYARIEQDAATFGECSVHVIAIPLSRGLGIVVDKGPRGIHVEEVLDGGDASHDGRLMHDDRLLAIDDHILTNATLEQAKSVLRKLKRNLNSRILNSKYVVVRFERESSSLNVFDTTTASLYLTDPSLGESMTLPSFQNDSVTPEAITGGLLCQCLQEDLTLPLMSSTPVGATSKIAPTSVGHAWNSPEISLRTTGTDTFAAPHTEGAFHSSLMLQPNSKVHLTRLESALSFLGLELSKGQKILLRRQLFVDQGGFVIFRDFVGLARSIHEAPLQDHGLHRQNKVESPRFSSGNYNLPSPLPDIVPQSFANVVPNGELETLFAEKDRIKKEVSTLKDRINDKAKKLRVVQEELIQVRNDLTRAKERKRRLQRDTRTELPKNDVVKKYDYESAISSLENEISSLKSSNVPITSEVVLRCQAVQKQIYDLVARLRRMERSKRNYFTATQKLMKFACKVYQVLHEDAHSERQSSMRSLSSSDHTYQYVAGCGPSPSLPRSKKTDSTRQFLLKEASNTISTARGLLASEPLPFGWEEAYTDVGTRYFINHLRGTTSWRNPSNPPVGRGGGH